MPTNSQVQPIGLPELIYQVKRELLAPQATGTDPAPIFCVEEIQVEAKVVITREGKAGLNIQVVSVGGGAAREDAQTVRVTLKPLRNREEMVKDLQKRAPELFDQMTEEALHLLKGPDKQEPFGWRVTQ